jgi:hypothetical protein
MIQGFGQRLALLFLLCWVAPTHGEEARRLKWTELIPPHLAEQALAPLAIDHASPDPMAQPTPWGALAMSELVVGALDQQRVRIPGFIVPLNITREQTVDEFLLVPYFGACVHVPPPPANQIIYVTTRRGLAADRIYEAWEVEGVLRTAAVDSAMAQAAYQLHAEQVKLYGDGP